MLYLQQYTLRNTICITKLTKKIYYQIYLDIYTDSQIIKCLSSNNDGKLINYILYWNNSEDDRGII